jgi:serine/threonine protein kinase
VITDFGLARAFQAGQRHVSASRLLVGSAAYLAPEQMDEAPLTEATDLYSFGVVLFELLTGKLPFCAKTPLGVALRRLHTPPPRPSAMRPELGERYDAFVLRCLARDPRERFQSAASARAALQKLIDAPQGRQRMFVGLSRKRAGALIAICTAAGASLAFGWSRAPESSQRTAESSLPQPHAAAATTTTTTTMAMTIADARDVTRQIGDATQALTSASGADQARSERDECEADNHAATAPQPRAERARVALSSADTAAQRGSSVKRTRASAPPKPSQLLTAEGFLDPFAH